MKDLKEKTIRGGLARLCAQGADFTMRLVSLMVLARLLNPKDFGLVGMVTAFTGVLILFRDFGLSAAAIQRPVVTEEQLSTLFWINVAVGAGLVLLVLAMAPFIAVFYHEPRLAESDGGLWRAAFSSTQQEYNTARFCNARCGLLRWRLSARSAWW